MAGFEVGEHEGAADEVQGGFVDDTGLMAGVDGLEQLIGGQHEVMARGRLDAEQAENAAGQPPQRSDDRREQGRKAMDGARRGQ